MKKKCTNCGNEFPEEIKFCTNCGNKLEETVEIPKQKAKKTIHPESKPIKRPKPVDKLLIPIVFIAIILSIVAITLPFVIEIEPDLISGSVSNDILSNNAVTSSKIADGEITDNDITDDGISKIAELAITGDNIIAKAIEMAHLSSEVVDTITGAGDIDNNSITSAMLKDYTIDTIDIKNNSITSAKISANAVGGSEIASESISPEHIIDDAVTYDKMDIKIKYGIENSAINGTTVIHGLEAVPTSVIITPIYGNNDYILHANVHSVTSDSFTIALWKETISTGVVSEVTSGISVYWIALR